MKRIFILLLSGAVGLQAEPALYEPFQYEPGLLAGAGEWTGEESQGAVRVVAGSLKVDALQAPVGGRVLLPATASKVHEAARPLSLASQDFWFSVVLRVDKTAGMDGPAPFGILRLTVPGGTSGPGLYLQKGTSPDQFQLAASKRANPQKVAVSAAGLATGAPHLIVGHYDTSVAPHALHIWIDPPDPGAGAPPAPSFSTFEGNDLPSPPDGIRVGGGVKSPGLFLDEIRVGLSFPDVAPGR